MIVNSFRDFHYRNSLSKQRRRRNTANPGTSQRYKKELPLLALKEENDEKDETRLAAGERNNMELRKVGCTRLDARYLEYCTGERIRALDWSSV